MKKILLLGDSIRINYQDYVKDELRDIADVRYPNDNGRFAAYTLRYTYEWINALSREDQIIFDIVHFNVGLWDVLRLSNEDDTFTSPEEYYSLLCRIIRRIKRFAPDAVIIFALSTKVREPGFTRGIGVGRRYNSDIEKFNEIAKQVVEIESIEMNDLWSVSDKLPDNARSDDVHFDTKVGAQALGSKVVECLKKYI